jgi:hypothetical protein
MRISATPFPRFFRTWVSFIEKLLAVRLPVRTIWGIW